MWLAAALAPSMLIDMAASLDVDQPLELSDIMPMDKKHYDKMRPPKYKGKYSDFFNQTIHCDILYR